MIPDNFLQACEKPLFFRIANATELGITPQPNALGESVRTWVRAVGGMQKEAVVASSQTGIVWRLASDEGDYLKGHDAAPCPLSFFTAGMVTSFMIEILALAHARGIAISRIRLVEDNYYTMKGSALKRTMTGGALPVELAVEIHADATPERLNQLVNDAVSAAPVSNLLRGQFDSLFTLTHNRRQISLGRVAAVQGSVQVDLGDSMGATTVDAGTASGLITKHGMTPRTDEATSSTGSSLTDEQNRRLHVRGICTLRRDGLLEIEQYLYNPHGSIFRFLADPDNLRAPGAATYLSAGIAFCFMTQFGRYASITRKALQDYSVVQNTHFLSGADTAGQMKPVETHVHLTSDQSDDFARTGLDMSEQTCFLHALCRTPLDVQVRLALD